MGGMARGWSPWCATSNCMILILWWRLFARCHARDVTICSTSEHYGYAAQSSLFDFEQHKLRMAWFHTASMIPLPDSGGCDIVRLPAYEATSYILRGVDLQLHTLRLQMRNFFQLVARPEVFSPHMLLGKAVAVTEATEMHVFLLQIINVFAFTYREVSMQEVLQGGLVLYEKTVTVVLCGKTTEVEALYTSGHVDAKVMLPGGSSFSNDGKVLVTTEDLHRWQNCFSFLMVTTRKWAQDPTNIRILQYFTAVMEIYDNHYARQPFEASSPEIAFLVTARRGMMGSMVIGGKLQGVSPMFQSFASKNVAGSLTTYFYFDSGARFWENHMTQMLDKTIVNELVANSELFFTHGWSTRHMEAGEFDDHLDLRVYAGLEGMIQNVTQSFNWTLSQSPGVQRPPLPLGAWDNWPPPEQATYCSGTVELPMNASGSFSDGHFEQGSYAPNSKCNWIIPQLQTQSSDDKQGPPPVLVEFPLLFLEPMSDVDTVQVVDPRAPHRLLAHFRGQVVGGAVRHAGPLEVKFQSNTIRRLNTMELEMGLNATFSHVGCQDDPRGCGAGTCGDDGVCVCPEGRSGVDCSLEHCLGTNVYELQPEESVLLRSNVADTYSPFADCRWEVHPPADCAACVVDVVFTSLQTELGHDAVQVATAPSNTAFWWDHPPNGTVVYSRSDLNASGLRVRGQPGMAVFVRLHSDEVVEAAGFEATVRVLDPAQAPAGASTSNCYDAQGGQPCSGRGVCAPGVAEGELGQCVCDTGYFGRTCRDEVCDLVNVAPALPTWTLVRRAHRGAIHWIARNSECQWAVAPAPLTGNGTNTLPPSSVRVTVKDWDFEGTRNNQLTLAADTREVTLKTNRCVSGQECELDAQCSSREGEVVGACDWTGDDDTLDMPPQFTLTVQSGINALHPHVTIVFQATFTTPSGHVAVAEEADPTVLVCEPKSGQRYTSLVFDYEALDCLPPPAEAPPEPPEKEFSNSLNKLVLIVLVPVMAVLMLAAAVLVYRNRSLTLAVNDLKYKGMKLDPGAFNIDLDSPLTKVTKYLGNIGKNQPFLARWLLPKNDLAEQAEALKTMLLEADNVHRPKLDTDQLQAEYGQDIVEYLLASTSTRRFHVEGALSEVSVETMRATAWMHSNNLSPQSGGISLTNSITSSSDLSDPSNEVTEEMCSIFEHAGKSYHVDLSCAYILKLKGTLCFVAMKVMDNWGLMKTLKISRSKMASYLLAVEDGYMDNPYHNVYHAADVTNRLATMFTKSGLADHLRETHNGRVQLLGVVLAAAVHDYGHPGTNNAYAVKTSQLYAKIYNDQAVYENSALYQALTLTDKPELDYSNRFSEDTKRLLRVTVIDLVLSTDMSRHFDIVTMVKSKVSSMVNKAEQKQRPSFLHAVPSSVAFQHETNAHPKEQLGIDLNRLSSDQMSLVFQFALKVADIGHCMLPLDQHKFWVGKLEKEFFSQGDKEKDAGLPISPLMDRTKPGPTNGGNQAGFFEVIIMPTISLWQTLFPGSADELQQQTVLSMRYWKSGEQVDCESDVASEFEG